MESPTDVLLRGVQKLEVVLALRGFRFHFRGSGTGSGGQFAWGEFVRTEQRLELHFRSSLGLVRYHLGEWSASHECYMRELGVWKQCLYPGFSNSPEDAFAGLAHDLSFAEEFLSGSAVILQRAAEKELLEIDDRQRRDAFVYSGDADRIEEVRQLFREGKYELVLTVATKFRDADVMPEAVSKMIQIAAKKARKLIGEDSN